MPTRYYSCAQWPDGQITRDLNDSARQAFAVCRLLGLHGYGGEGVIFPVDTWIEEHTETTVTAIRI